MTAKYRYMVLNVLADGLEDLLNELEDLASGCYQVISIFPFNKSESRQIVTVVVRVDLIDDEIPFDEEEIKRKLGF